MPVEGLDSNQWQCGVIDLSLRTSEGTLVDYVGNALISFPAQGHIIEFTCKTTINRIARIDIPLFVSSASVVCLSVNGRYVSTWEFPPSEGEVPVLHRLMADLTKWTEVSETSSVRMRISYRREHGATTILNDSDQPPYSPRVIQEWNAPAALQSTSFLILAWACILACGILGVAYVRPLGDTFRVYATLTVVGGWAVSVLGIPDFAKIPLRAMIRRAYARTRPKRLAAIVALTILFLIAGSGASVVVYSLVTRYRYDQLVSNLVRMESTQDPLAIRSAFVLLPWRTEAQILFERHAYKLRTQASIVALRKYVETFVRDAGVKVAVDRARMNTEMSLSLQTSPDARWFNDPVVWYASLLPEAEDDDQTTFLEEAIRLLQDRGPPNAFPQAYLLRMSFELQLKKDDSNEVRKARNELIGFLKTDEDATYITSHEYQIASDALAASYIRECEATTAAHWFRNELEARRRSASNEGYALVHRPPQKLLLYHMFVSYSGVEESDSEVANRILDFTDGSSKCKPFRETFTKEFLQRPEYAEYKNRAPWMEHTILGTNLETLVRESLQLGWRY